ncbi:thioesterase II family protein [Streptomyces sp. MMBL 11-1]|uniref:thioesterase II family protein n=1 Tax=Streptomyces sp. MMBL 11-1 TaxID=3026420 RepID=UPI0023619463|nr:alpha/beta fold hydrolase [Streptomyces sp. MMBL 11-1]
MARFSPALDPRGLLAAKRWIVRPQRVAEPRLRLFCLPHAGAGAAAFTPWAKLVGHDVELCAVRFPGRENRIEEPLFEDLQRLVDELERAVTPLTDRPYAIIGHCSGSIVGLELARRLRDRGRPGPRALIVSSIPGPSRRTSESIHLLPRTEFFERVARFGGIDESVLDSPEMMELFETTMRTDFRMVEQAPYVPAEPLDAPVVAVGGRDDPFVSYDDLEAWRGETSGDFTLHHLDAGHFVLDEVMDLVVRTLV